MNVIENTCVAKPKPRSVLWPVVGVVVFSAALYWTYSHIAGGCTGIQDVITFCEVHSK